MKYIVQIRKMILWMLAAMILAGGLQATGVQAAGVRKNTDVNLTAETISSLEKKIGEAWNAHSERCDISELKIFLTSKESIREVYFGFLYKNPQYFYVGMRLGFIYNSSENGSEDGAGGRLCKALVISYTYDKQNVLSMLKSMNETVGTIMTGVKTEWSDLEKALYLHDFLCLNCSYSVGTSNYTAYDALVLKKAACQGYAQAYLYLLKQAGIESYMVYSSALCHAWNLVRINNEFYHVDVTWDDPVPDCRGRAKHNYFLKSATAFGLDGKHSRAADWKIYNGADPHKFDRRGYDKAFWKKSDNAFIPIDGKWYNYDAQKKAIYRYSCDGAKFKRQKKLKSLKQYKWNLYGSDKKTYKEKYVGVTGNGKYLYYTTPTEVYRLKASGGKAKKIYTLKKKQKKKGYIYGIFIDKNKLKIRVTKKNTKKGKTYKVKNLAS